MVKTDRVSPEEIEYYGENYQLSKEKAMGMPFHRYIVQEVWNKKTFNQKSNRFISFRKSLEFKKNEAGEQYGKSEC